MGLYTGEMEADPIFPISTDPIAMLEARSELRAMDGAWDRLEGRHRLIVKMRLEGHTWKAAGKAIERSAVRAQQLYRRALHDLREAKERFPPALAREDVEQQMRGWYRALQKQRQDEAKEKLDRLIRIEWYKNLEKERWEQDLALKAAKAERISHESYSSGRIVRNGVEVWPPWPKRG